MNLYESIKTYTHTPYVIRVWREVDPTKENQISDYALSTPDKDVCACLSSLGENTIINLANDIRGLPNVNAVEVRLQVPINNGGVVIYTNWP